MCIGIVLEIAALTCKKKHIKNHIFIEFFDSWCRTIQNKASTEMWGFVVSGALLFSPRPPALLDTPSPPVDLTVTTVAPQAHFKRFMPKYEPAIIIAYP